MPAMSISDSHDIRKVQLLKYVRRHLSPYVYFSDWDSSDSSATMGIQIQEPILDNERPTIRSILLKNVGTIQWNKKGKPIGPARSEFGKRVVEQYTRLINRSHSILLPAIYKRLVRVPEVSVAMAPFRKIILTIEEMGELNREKLQSERSKNRDVARYIFLLQELDFVRQEDGIVLPGSKMQGLKAQHIEPPQLYEEILSEVMQKRSKYLTEVMHLTMMTPYLRWSNSYYLPSYEAERLVEFDREEFFRIYTAYYRVRERQSMFIDQLQKVVDASILKRKDRYYVGQEDIFKTFSKRADEERLLQTA